MGVLNYAHAGAANLGALTVTVETKDWKDADGSAAAIGSAEAISTTDAATTFAKGQQTDGTGDTQGFKEAYRMKFLFKASATATSRPAPLPPTSRRGSTWTSCL